LSINKSNIGKRKEEIEKWEENESSAVGGLRLEADHLKNED
jgi:hypothetical protein